MKTMLSRLGGRGWIFRRLEPFSLKQLGSRKRIDVWHGVDLTGHYVLVFQVAKKSRILQSEVEEWFLLANRIEQFFGYAIKKRLVLIEGPLCSKAKAKMEEAGWLIL